MPLCIDGQEFKCANAGCQKVYLTKKEKVFKTNLIAIIPEAFQHDIGALAQHGPSQMKRITDLIGSSLSELRVQLISSCWGARKMILHEKKCFPGTECMCFLFSFPRSVRTP